VRTAFQLPHINKHVWVRHSDPTQHMFHWRDVQFLDLLHRVHTVLGSSSSVTASLMPSEQEIAVFQRVSRETRIPMPVQWKEPKSSFESQMGRGEKEYNPDIPYEDEKQYEMYKKLKEQDVLWKQPDNSNDFYSLLRKQNLKSSSHPRNPEFPMNKKFSVVFHEPSDDQLKKMLTCMQIDFPFGTEPEVISSMHHFLISNAKKLRIWEWYHTPIICGAPRYSIIDNCILGIPFGCSVEKLNMYLEKNLPILRNNGEIFRKRLDIIGDKMLQLQEYLHLTDIKTDLFVSHDKIEACLDHLLDCKDLLNSCNIQTLSIRIHNVENFPFFSNVSGTISLPYDISDERLRRFLINHKKANTFANYRIAKRSISHLHRILSSKIGIKYITIPNSVKENTVEYQSLLLRILTYISDHAPYNTLKNITISFLILIKLQFAIKIVY